MVVLKANGGERADVSTGQEVTFEALVEVPPGAGYIVGAAWDFEGAGDFPQSERIENPRASSSQVEMKATHRFAKPGTYFPALRVVSNREGDPATPYARISNLGRVRVVVK